jgi:hypothetical protein
LLTIECQGYIGSHSKESFEHIVPEFLEKVKDSLEVQSNLNFDWQTSKTIRKILINFSCLKITFESLHCMLDGHRFQGDPEEWLSVWSSCEPSFLRPQDPKTNI